MNPEEHVADFIDHVNLQFKLIFDAVELNRTMIRSLQREIYKYQKVIEEKISNQESKSEYRNNIINSLLEWKKEPLGPENITEQTKVNPDPTPHPTKNDQK